MFKKITTILGLVIVLTVISATGYAVLENKFTVAQASENTCNAAKDLSADISSDNKSVSITNASKDCSYKVGYASYGVYNWDNAKFLSTQKLFDHSVKTIKANSKITISIDVPACSYQVDAFYGDVITKFSSDNTYANRKLASDNNLKKGLCVPTSTPSPSPTPTPTPTPENPVVSVSTYCVDQAPKISISWNEAKQGSKGYHIDVTTNDSFSNGGYAVVIPSNETSASFTNFNSFSSFGNANGTLAMKSNTTYKVRVLYVATGKYSEVKTITTNDCKPYVPPTFSGVCIANTSYTGSGTTVTYTANATGGNGSYTYSWSGTDDLSGNSKSVNKIYWTAGDKKAHVVISSNGKTVTADCSTTVYTGGTYNPPANLSAVCVASPSTVFVGQAATYTATAYNGNGSYTYSWSGDENASSNVNKLITSYSTIGQKNAKVTVYSNNQTVTANCSVNVIAATTTGGIYLSQVPYTGIGSNIRVFFFLIALIGWSAIIGYVLIKRKASKNGMTVAEFINGSRTPVFNNAVAASTLTMNRPSFVSELPVRTAPVESPFVSPIAPVTTGTTSQTLVDLLTRGEDQEVIVTLQNMQIKGQLVSEVITNLAVELDNVIKARNGEVSNVDTRISNSLATWSNDEITYSIRALVHALNQTSTSVYAASKIALIKIAELAKVKNFA